jgi:N-terminal domain of anti-restriction factor ArdC
MSISKQELQAEALSRATSGHSLTNWPAIFAGFTAKGIPESDILPRVNVLTYHAWRAKGRQVRRGERGVKVTTWISPKDKAEGDDGKKTRPTKMPWCATVFHESQTDPIG